MDPMKEAEAAGTQIRNRMSTLADGVRKEGRDWMGWSCSGARTRSLRGAGRHLPGRRASRASPNAANAQPDPAVEESVS